MNGCAEPSCQPQPGNLHDGALVACHLPHHVRTCPPWLKKRKSLRSICPPWLRFGDDHADRQLYQHRDNELLRAAPHRGVGPSRVTAQRRRHRADITFVLRWQWQGISRLIHAKKPSINTSREHPQGLVTASLCWHLPARDVAARSVHLPIRVIFVSPPRGLSWHQRAEVAAGRTSRGRAVHKRRP